MPWSEKARGEAWPAVQRGERVAAELGAFRTAVTQRFEDDGVRQMLRAVGRPGAVNAPSIAPQQQPALDQMAEVTATLKAGERAGINLAQRQAESERQGQRRGLRM